MQIPTDPTEMMLTDQVVDDFQFEAIVTASIPEAVNTIHLLAPSNRLEGNDDVEKCEVERHHNVLEITPSKDDFLRLVRLYVRGANHPVFDVLPEESAEAMAQRNPYTCGTRMSPRVVQKNGNTSQPTLLYYSVESLNDELKAFVYVPRLESVGTSFEVSSSLELEILNYLTAMVMNIYNEHEKAKVFYDRAKVQ